MTTKYQVAIVGGGPVGMALAVELGQRGISTVVVERHLEVGRIPKGQSLTNRTLEHFYFWRCVEQLRNSRLLPPNYPIGGVTAYGNLMSDYWYVPELEGRQRGSGAAKRPYFFQANERLPQYITEEVLRSRAKELSTVTTLYGKAVKSVEQGDDGVRLAASSEEWPYEDEEILADYAVGCDGARSLVRSQLGIEQHGSDFDQKMVLAVFSSPQLHEGMTRFPERTTYHVVNPDLEGKWQFFGRVEVGKSFFFHAPVPRDTTAADVDLIHSTMEQAAGFSFDLEWEHVGFWELRINVADTYGSGRIFIAGDACHSHPPYGGFGLNSGLEDVTNLGWKLAARLDGWGGDGLLDSYSEERQPIFVQTGEQVIAAGIRREAEWLSKHNLERDPDDFKKAWEVRIGGGSGRDTSYEVHYDASSVVVGDPDGTTGVAGRLSYEARPGHHLAPATLNSGRNVFEELGNGFTLLAFDPPEDLVGAFETVANSSGVPLKVIRDTLAGERADYGARLILVRPDQFVAWVGDSGIEAAAILERVSGHR